MVTPGAGELVTVGTLGSGPSGNAEGFRYNLGFAIVSILTRDCLNVLEEVQLTIICRVGNMSHVFLKLIVFVCFVCFVVFCHDESCDCDYYVGYCKTDCHLN